MIDSQTSTTTLIVPPLPTTCYSPEYLEKNTLLVSIHGRIIRTPTVEVKQNPKPIASAFAQYRDTNRVDTGTTTDNFTRRAVCAFQFRLGHRAPDLYGRLEKFCDIVAIGRAVLANGTVCHSAVVRRTGYSRIGDSDFEVFESLTPHVTGLSTKNRDDVHFEFIQTWMQMQTEVYSNVDLLYSDLVTPDTVLEEWRGRDHFDVLADVQQSCGTVKARRTARQKFVAENHRRLEQMWRAAHEPSRKRSLIEVSDPSIVDFHCLAIPPSQMMFRYVDLTDNLVKEFSGRDWLRQWHQTHSIVFAGDAGLGKTPVAIAYGSCVSQLFKHVTGPRFYKICQAEQLPRDTMAPGVVILFDEWRPSLPRGHNPPHTIDELKVLLDAEHGGGITGKGANGRSTGAIEFAAGQPRLITTNASTPDAFLRHLPANIFTAGALTPSIIANLCTDTRAILKRIAWFDVRERLIPAESSEQYRSVRGRASTEAFDCMFAAVVP